MGLFSSKKITYVSSVAYNMAGDENERVKYIKALVLQNIMSGTKATIGESLRAGYLKGPQMDLRSYYRWAAENYTTVGLPSAQINGFETMNHSLIISQMPQQAGKSISLQTAQIQTADYTMWAEQYILDNFPDRYDGDWESFMQDDGNIIIQFADHPSVTFTPVNFDQNADYIYTIYVYVTSGVTEPTVTGPEIVIPPSESFPSTAGWTSVYDNTTTEVVNLDTVTETVVSYSDGRPDEITTDVVSNAESYDKRLAKHTQTFTGQDPDVSTTRIITRLSERYFFTDAAITQDVTTTTTSEVVGDVTVTTTTTITTDVLNVERSHRTDKTDTVGTAISNQRIWLYRIGSGNTVLDGMVNNPQRFPGEFYSPMPIRLENRFISDSYYPAMFEQTEKAYKKLTKKKFSTLVDSIADNDNLGDIDFAFLVFGVSLNVKEVSCRKYLYKFFDQLRETAAYGNPQYAAFLNQLAAYNAAIDAWSPGMSIPALPWLRTNEIRIKSQGTVNIPYDIRLSWVNITKTEGTGVGKAGAKTGDIWFEVRPNMTWAQYIIRSRNTSEESYTKLVQGDNYVLEVVRLYWQTAPDKYEYLEILGMKHINYVYNGKYVQITAREALQDTDESGFIVPLHYRVMKEMSLKDSSQMSTACVFVVFNCYQIVKQKWYQRGIFKILFVIVFAIVSVIFTGGAGLGLLGTHISVGASLGFSGLTAAIVGSVVNALAAVVLMQIISFASTAILGDKLGGLLSAVIGFVVMNVIATFQQTGMLGFDWGSMMKAENLLKLTDALSQGYSGYMQGVAMDYQAKTQGMMSSYKSESERITEMWATNIGYSDIAMNASWITSSSINYTYESSDTFLTRTLLTGMDIAQMSHDMLNDFATLNLTLPNAYT